MHCLILLLSIFMLSVQATEQFTPSLNPDAGTKKDYNNFSLVATNFFGHQSFMYMQLYHVDSSNRTSTIVIPSNHKPSAPRSEPSNNNAPVAPKQPKFTTRINLAQKFCDCLMKLCCTQMPTNTASPTPAIPLADMSFSKPLLTPRSNKNSATNNPFSRRNKIDKQ